MHSFHLDNEHLIHAPKFRTELTRLYWSSALVNLGSGMIGIFVPVYLFNLGYSISDILLYFIYFWGGSALFIAYFSGWVTARFGPKHAIATGNVSLVISLFLLITLSDIGWPLWMIAGFISLSADLGWIGVQTEISKLSDGSNSGKTFAKNFISGKLAGALSPLMGGLIATFIDVRYSFVVALFFVVAALVVIVGGEEPVVSPQKLRISKIKPRTLFPEFHGVLSLSIDFMVGANLWPLFIAAFIITGENSYASLGAIVSIGQLVALVVLMIVAQRSDKNGGKKYARIGIPLVSIVHLLRIFANSVVSVFFINTAAVNLAGIDRVPIYKSMYRLVNKMEGYRISFFTYCVIIMDFVRVVPLMILFVMTAWLSEQHVLQVSFGLGSIAVLQALFWLKLKKPHGHTSQK